MGATTASRTRGATYGMTVIARIVGVEGVAVVACIIGVEVVTVVACIAGVYNLGLNKLVRVNSIAQISV